MLNINKKKTIIKKTKENKEEKQIENKYLEIKCKTQNETQLQGNSIAAWTTSLNLDITCTILIVDFS